MGVKLDMYGEGSKQVGSWGGGAGKFNAPLESIVQLSSCRWHPRLFAVEIVLSTVYTIAHSVEQIKHKVDVLEKLRAGITP